MATVKIKDKDNMTDAEKRRVWEQRYGNIKPKKVSRKRTEKELIDDDKVWR